MEVLTLQFGHFANHVGAHFWNLQDEIAALEGQRSEDEGASNTPEFDFERLLCRIDRRRGEVSWRPRLVLVDRKSAMGAAGVCDAESGAAAAESAAASSGGGGLWDFMTVSHHADAYSSHPFQQDLVKEERAALAAHYGAGWDARGANWDLMDVDAEDDDADCEEPEEGWDGGVAYGTGTAPESQFVRTSAEYQFRDTVRTWTDFLKVKLPDRTVHELQGCHHGVAPFATFFDGLAIHGRDDEQEILDLVRRQAELCDQLDAVHAILDAHNGFGGIGDIVLRWIHEEQPKCGTLVAAVQPELHEDAAMEQNEETGGLGDGPCSAKLDTEACAWISAAFSLAGALQVGVQAWLPLAVPLWSTKGPPSIPDLRRDSLYETSAIVASALETATLPYRLRNGPRPSLFLAGLAPNHRPVCGLLHAMPMPPTPTLGPALFDLAGTPALAGNPYTSVVLRGADPRRLLELTGSLHPRARRHCFTHASPLPLPLPFPQFFAPSVTSSGLVVHGGAPGQERCGDVEECPTATHVHAASEAGRSMALRRMLQTLKSRQRSSWAAMVQERHGVEADDFREVLETVNDHLECSAASDDSESG
eukprot:CAMPEP_0117504118 /NCGR_PEP_ID=MMETSP0784-20121206/24683_1 /TAXON_ID=39447 /ORGANISM="" /LENGTH=590 /DNA_ID=CAMNT_0005299461 /DNA_START=98 /DNA_END=1866 /DNA_ORIENTATION=-